MGMWLVESYDSRSNTLNLPSGERLPITENDIAATLGLPLGDIEITKRESKQVSDLLAEWRKIFGKVTGHITPHTMAEKMLTLKAADPWFKRHFALLVMSVLVEPQVNGYVNQNYIDNLLNVHNIKRLNWCRMLINSLIASKQAWLDSADGRYGGPIVFLTVFYVDRVVLYRRTIPRSFPAMANWTFKLLRQRQQTEIKSGGFGYGRVDVALPVQSTPCSDRNPSIGQSDVPPQPPSCEEDAPLPHGLQEFIDEVTTNTRTIAKSLLWISRLIENAPATVLEHDTFKQMFESARQMLGFKAQEDGQLTFTQQEDAYWSDPEFLKAVDEIVRAVNKRTFLNHMPTFSLGLSQEGTSRDTPTMNANAQDYQDNDEAPENEDVQLDGLDGQTTEKAQEDTENITKAANQECVQEAEQVNINDEITPVGQGQEAPGSDPPHPPQPADKGKGPARVNSPIRPRPSSYVLDLDQPISPTEEAIRKWVLDNPNPDLTQELFKYDGRVIYWKDMLTMKPDTNIAVSIIDAWSVILNIRESERGCTKFIASTWSTLYTVVDPQGDGDVRFGRFKAKYLEDKTIVADVMWHKILYFLFPIVASNHYYLMSISPLMERYDIIDNSSVTVKKENKYGYVIANLQKFFSKFLFDMKTTYKAEKVQKLKSKIMKMPWRDAQNKMDCGIFLMRHLETFRGQTQAEWQCGLHKNNKDQLNKLRVRYLAAMIMSDVNEHKERNIQQAAEFGI
ncbi:PREDICTED: uncharacterized protein LOC109171666 [Ipomoea nil]|uniref:uncharacterized protein LOC109171666 n=1 Tax=Ipomoea nil TaxID=35883 RepID=UPI000901D80B|nr:PREDICTED: uncharacterized protein LOC109171666 [Ipomoea nil]